MALRELLLPWDGQPQEAVQLSDWARGLGFREALLPGLSDTGAEGVLRRHSSIGTTVSSVATEDGIVRRIVYGNDFYSDDGALDPRQGYVWVMRGCVSSISVWGGIMSRVTDDTGANSWSWQRNDNDGQQLLVVQGGGLYTVMSSGLVGAYDSVPRTWVGGWDGARLWLWRDGVLLGSTPCTATPAYTPGSGQIRLGARDWNTATLDVTLAAFAVGRGPDQALADALSGPGVWQLFAPRSIWVPVSTTGGGSTDASLSLAQTLAPAALVAGAQTIVSAGASQALAAPSLSSSAGAVVSAGANQALPRPTQAAAAAALVAGSASQALPPAALTATAGAVVSLSSARTLPAATISASAAAIVSAQASQTLPAPTLSATASLTNSVSLSAAQTLPRPAMTAGAAVLVSAQAAQTLPAPALVVAASVGNSIGLSVAQVLPPATLTAAARALVSAGVAQQLLAPAQPASAGVVVSATVGQALPAPALVSVASTVEPPTLQPGRRRAVGIPVIRRAVGVPVIRRASSMATVTKAAVLDIDEGDVLVFDFTGQLAGAAISGAEVEVDVRSGAAPDGSALKVGDPVVQGSSVLQRVQGAGAPADYAVRCVAQCSDGLPRVIVMALPVRRQ